MNSTIYLFRHGITEGNLKNMYYGKTDLQLAPEGVEQINALKAEGFYPQIEDASYFTSGMLRANQTLKEIYGPVPYTIIPILREMNFGEFEMHTAEQLKDNKDYQEWVNDKKGTIAPPDGESKVKFFERANRGFDELVNYTWLDCLKHRHNGKDTNTICICHGGVIAAIMTQHFDADLRLSLIHI